jgi:hypothetical protein
LKGRLYKMDKRKYQAKILTAEYKSLHSYEDCNFTEMAYKLKDGTRIIEYKGNRLSLYGVMISFRKHISKSGVYSISESDSEMWKNIRGKNEKENFFIDWEKQYGDQLNEDYESALKCIGENELPY